MDNARIFFALLPVSTAKLCHEHDDERLQNGGELHLDGEVISLSDDLPSNTTLKTGKVKREVLHKALEPF